LAELGKTTKGWFFGFKLHVIIDEKGNLMRVKLTKGNVDDRQVVPQMTEGLLGLLFGDKGYS
jgi:transposase